MAGIGFLSPPDLSQYTSLQDVEAEIAESRTVAGVWTGVQTHDGVLVLFQNTGDAHPRLQVGELAAGIVGILGGPGTLAGDTSFIRDAAGVWKANAKLLVGTEIEIDGALNHDGTTVGLYGVAPVTRRAAYTQTYDVATRTNVASVAPTPVADGATGVTPFGYATAAQANAIKDAVRTLVITDIPAIKQLLNSVIDDLQALGIAQ